MAATASGLADTLVADLGLTGIPFTNVKNGCATGGSALMSAVNAIRSGAAEIALAVGFDKHPRGAFDPRPEDWGLPAAYGEAGLMVTTQFFGIKIARYLREHGISRADPGPGGGEGLPQRHPQPQRLATRADLGRRDRRSGHGQRPADPVHVLLTRARAARRSSSPATPWPPASGRAGAPARRGHPHPAVRLLRGLQPLDPGHRPCPPASARDAAAAAFAAAGVGPDDVDVAQLQDTESGAEIMHLAECGFCKDGEQEAMVAAGETEIGGRLPVNTDGGCIANGEPIGASGLRQVHEIVTQLRGEAGARQVAGRRGSASPMSTAPRASAPARCWRSEG